MHESPLKLGNREWNFLALNLDLYTTARETPKYVIVPIRLLGGILKAAVDSPVQKPTVKFSVHYLPAFRMFSRRDSET
jgi:hypothetical protein